MALDLDSYSEKIENLKAKLGRARFLRHLSTLESMLKTFRPGERIVLYALISVLSLSALFLLAGANAAVSVQVPARGGSITEGVVGPVRFVNPLLTLSGPDKDLTMLVYSGLMRATPFGDLIPDLASSYEISKDGTAYTFTLRPNLTFHDGTSVSAEDVLFTIQRAQNQDIKSVHRADWEGVSVSAPDSHTVVFTLPHAYAPFLENTTLGILPKHLWENVSAEEFPFTPLNTNPVGSGPYKIVGSDTNATGAITRYDLGSFKGFALGSTYIQKMTILFYPNEGSLINAFNAGRIDSFAGISPKEVESITRRDTSAIRAPLPRTFGVFLNQNKNAMFADLAVRSALDTAIDKKKIVRDVLKGFGATLEGPIPPGVLGNTSLALPRPLEKETPQESTPSNGNAEKARAILARAGWSFDRAAQIWKKKKTTLEFTLATADEPELAGTAQALATAWREIGVKVDLHVYPLSEFNSVVLRPRAYDAALFGEVVGRTLDLFAFWHSSQRNDPGLNLAMYANTKVDSLLARARTTINRKEREKLYEQFTAYIMQDQPAIFLYAPEFIYIVPSAVEGIRLGTLTTPAERFLNIYEWYSDTERVWSIFTNQNHLSDQ